MVYIGTLSGIIRPHHDCPHYHALNRLGGSRRLPGNRRGPVLRVGHRRKQPHCSSPSSRLSRTLSPSDAGRRLVFRTHLGCATHPATRSSAKFQSFGVILIARTVRVGWHVPKRARAHSVSARPLRIASRCPGPTASTGDSCGLPSRTPSRCQAISTS